MAEAGELDFSNLDGMDNIEWSDVEGELQQNREMLLKEAQEAKQPSDNAVSTENTGKDKESDIPSEMGVDFLLDIPLQLTVEIGRTRMLIKELLNVDIGSIIELRKKVGASMNVLINEKLVAKGEIVVQNEKFGLKITEILDQKERVRKLQDS